MKIWRRGVADAPARDSATVVHLMLEGNVRVAVAEAVLGNNNGPAVVD